MVEIRDVYKKFEDFVVLDGVSINVEDNENFVIFGRSGTGKSVLLKCIVRLMEVDSGAIFIEGEDVTSLPLKKLNELRKQIGFLFQSSALYDSMSVRENLEFPLVRNFKFTTAEREAKVKSVLEKVNLEESINKMPAELSGGMKKRIGLARTIITEPKLILYDEPTTGLDPITSKEISHLILELQKDLNTTSIIVTHDLICAKIIASYAVVLKDGKVMYKGDLDSLTTAEEPFLKNFFTNEYEEFNNGSN